MALARGCSVALVTLVALSIPVSAQEPRLTDVLTRAAAYMTAFQQQLAGIVAEETYTQRVTSDRFLRARELKSDLLLVRPIGTQRYVEFRDVFEVDGVSVGDRQERLVKLFLNPPPDAEIQLQRVMKESARYNIGNYTRTMNTPLLTVSFLLPSYQKRFRFDHKGRAGEDVWLIAYRERDKPSIIRTPEGESLTSKGQFWVNTKSGAITRSELVIEHERFRAVLDVDFRLEPTLGFLVPAEMSEVYASRGEHRVEGHARYGRFRSFQVKVDERIRLVQQ
jgi:hypothetical protein